MRNFSKIPTGTSWKEIWTRFKSGDQAAFRLLYHKHIDFLFGYGTKLTANTAVVEDAIQDLFLYLITKRDHITTPNHIRFYLLKAFKRILLEKIKKDRSYQSGVDPSEILFDLVLKPSDTEEFLITEKKYALIEKLVENLDARKKEILFLKFYSGFSYAEIADMVGMQLDSVKKTVYRIIASFREVIRDHPIELFFLFLSSSVH